MKNNKMQSSVKTIGSLVLLGALAFSASKSFKANKTSKAEEESTLGLIEDNVDFDDLEPTEEELREIEKEEKYIDLFYLLDDYYTTIEDLDLDEEEDI